MSSSGASPSAPQDFLISSFLVAAGCGLFLWMCYTSAEILAALKLLAFQDRGKHRSGRFRFVRFSSICSGSGVVFEYNIPQSTAPQNPNTLCIMVKQKKRRRRKKTGSHHLPSPALCALACATHLVFLRISSTSCLMWSSMNSIFSCLRARAFCRRTMRSTSTALSTSGKLSTTTTDGPDMLSGDRSSTPLLPPWRAFKEPGKWQWIETDINNG